MSESHANGKNTQSQTENTQTHNPDLVVGHSGKLGLEKPVEEFDNTTLQQAEEQGLLSRPDHPGTLLEQTDKKSHTGLFVGGGAIALLAVGLGYFIGQDSDNERRQPLVPAVMEDVVDEEITTTTTEQLVTTTTIEAVTQSGNFVSIERRNGEVIEVPLISDEDIASGEAVRTVKEVASLFMTTGNESIIDSFIDRERAGNAIDNWRSIRMELNMDDTSLFSDTYSLRYDTSDIATRIVSLQDTYAEIRFSGGEFIHEDPYVEDWDEYNFSGDNILNPDADVNLDITAHFVKSGDTWRFIGYAIQ